MRRSTLNKRIGFVQAQNGAQALLANSDIPPRAFLCPSMAAEVASACIGTAPAATYVTTGTFSTAGRPQQDLVKTLRLCSINVHFLLDNFMEPCADRLQQVITQVEADVLLFQELPLPSHSECGSAFHEVLQELGYQHAVHSPVLFYSPNGTACGNAIYSRRPFAITGSHNHGAADIPPPSSRLLEDEKYLEQHHETRAAVSATLCLFDELAGGQQGQSTTPLNPSSLADLSLSSSSSSYSSFPPPHPASLKSPTTSSPTLSDGGLNDPPNTVDSSTQHKTYLTVTSIHLDAFADMKGAAYGDRIRRREFERYLEFLLERTDRIAASCVDAGICSLFLAFVSMTDSTKLHPL